EFENLLEPLDLILGLALVFLEGSLQVFRLGSLCHLRKSGEDLLFRVVDVFQSLVKEVFKHLLFFGHGHLLDMLPVRDGATLRDVESSGAAARRKETLGSSFSCQHRQASMTICLNRQPLFSACLTLYRRNAICHGEPVLATACLWCRPCSTGMLLVRSKVYFFFLGTLLPFLRALENAMAIACLRFFTLPPFPTLPLFALPLL